MDGGVDVDEAQMAGASSPLEQQLSEENSDHPDGQVEDSVNPADEDEVVMKSADEDAGEDDADEDENVEHVKVDWDRANALVSALERSIEEAPYSDVAIRLDDQTVVRAHKVVLGQYSRLLNRLFKAQQCCKGDRCMRRDDCDLHLHDVSQTTLNQLLSVLYVGSCAFDSEQEQRDFCSVLKMLDIRFPPSSGLDLTMLAGYEKPKSIPDSISDEDEAKETSMLRSLLNTPSAGGNIEDEGSTDFTSTSRKSLYAQSLNCAPKPDKDIAEDESQEEEQQESIEECRFCKTQETGKQALFAHYSQEHFSTHMKKEFGQLTACPECEQSFDSAPELHQHLGTEHAKVEKYLKYCLNSDKDLSCTHCNDDFDQPSNLVKHLANKHYSQTLKNMYPFTGDCPMPNCKRQLVSPGQQLSHLSLKHNVLYKVIPSAMSQQLQKLIAIERQGLAEKRLAAQAAAQQQQATETGVKKPQQQPTTAAIPPLPKLTNMMAQTAHNLGCPLCEYSFKSPKGLTAHLVQHYLPMIEKKFSHAISSCPYCNFQHGTRPHLLHHIVVAHRKLHEFVPMEVRQALKGSGVFELQQQQQSNVAASSMEQGGLNGNSSGRFASNTNVRQNMMPPLSSLMQQQPDLQQQTVAQQQQQSHPAFQTLTQVDMRKTCPGCDQVFGIQSSLNRHISNVHIKAELLNNCDTLKMQCKLCPGVFKDVRTLVTHVGISHGFIKRFMDKHKDKAATFGSPGASRPAMPQPAASRAAPQQPSEPLTYVCPICNKVGFPTWTTWKKHIYHHMSTEIRAHYDKIGKDCPICGKHFESYGQNTLHVAVIHNKVFNFLPPEMRLAMKKAGLTSNKNKRQINCPLCPGEKAIYGELTFRQHLYTHCADRIRKLYNKNGRQCSMCRFAAGDTETVVQHIAISHNKLVEFLPPDVVQTLRQAGIDLMQEGGQGASSSGPGPFMKRDPAPSTSSGVNSFSFPNGSISLTRVSSGQQQQQQRQLARQTPVAKAGVGLPQAPVPMFMNQKPLIYREGPPVLICPICNRQDFKKRLHLKRHLLSIHFKKAFYTRFGHIDKQCPFCQYATPCHNEALRHIAFTHKQLKEVMPNEMIQLLIDNGVMELDSLEEKGKGIDVMPMQASAQLRNDNPDDDTSGFGADSSHLLHGITPRYEPPKPQYSRAKPILYCPVCQRQDFPTRMYLKRHILSHYMADFKERYKDYPLICPYCNHQSGCVKHNMIHIAITHRKLKDLLPENLATQLIQNGVLELNDENSEDQQQQEHFLQQQQQQADDSMADQSQGGDGDTEEDAMDPSMFMDTMMTEDQQSEPLEFGGGQAESPRKRARDASDDNLTSPEGKRMQYESPSMAMTRPPYEQEMVQPELMYQTSDQVDLHTCMVCGTRLNKPHDMRRHMLTHYRPFLRAETAAHNKICPLCNTQIKHSDKYLFHYFLTHRQFYNVDALPEQVKRHLGRSIESNLAHNQRYPLIAAESTLPLEQEQQTDFSLADTVGHSVGSGVEEEDTVAGDEEEGVMDVPVVEDEDEEEEEDMEEPVEVQPLQEMTTYDQDEDDSEEVTAEVNVEEEESGGPLTLEESDAGEEEDEEEG